MTTLGEYIKVQGGYAYKSKDFIESSDNKVLKIKNVRFGTIDYSEPAYVSNEIAEATKNWKVKEGDVLISMTGSGPNAPQSLVGRVARVWKNEPDAWINQRVGRVCLLDEAPVHLDFIFYWLSLPQSQDYLVSNSSGSANQANISGKIIESLPCPKVDYQISKQIADLARKFDEKIILNSQTNQTLEEMAQAIFKSWFVDFDPVKAKMNGELPEGMDAATASLFPEKLVESELGLIPEGWIIHKTQDLFEVKDGTHDSPKKAEEGHYLVTSKHITKGKIDTSSAYLISDADFEKVNQRSKVDSFDILLTMIGTVGEVVVVYDNPVEFAIKNVGLFKTSQRPELVWLFYWHLRSFKMKHYLEVRMAGTTQQYLTLKTLRTIPVVLPSDKLLEKFNEVVAPLMEKISDNQNQNKTLSNLRDTLLPKLLLGEIDLETTEELVEVN
ncbi:restriction endonuclease subunit S [Vibrio cyclitrophicus]|uniref:restriction endonuclease subunit S n=1 Tax=Vibrio cyclitrophicus TaxID=47951 RepID=UPI0035A5EFAC